MTCTPDRDSHQVREHGVPGGCATRGAGPRPCQQVEEVHAGAVRATRCASPIDQHRYVAACMLGKGIGDEER